MHKFPRTEVAGISLSRLIIGTNWILGWSHRGKASDDAIKSKFTDRESIFPMLETYMQYDIDTLMGPVSQSPLMLDSILYAQEKLGREIIIVDTPIVNVDDTQSAREEARRTIKKSAETGAKFCLIHHSSAEQLVNKNKATIERIGDYTQMIREEGLIPGLSAHMPELVVYSDDNGYDIETYIQIYNCMGFMMQVEIETVASIISKAKKPVMTIKPMAAGRCTPFVGLNFSWNTIRPCDMITVGCNNADEVYEDIEISLAAIERRMPDIEKRSSINAEQAVFGDGRNVK